MATGARGEGILTVNEDGQDREYRVLYTNRAIAEAEQRTGKTALRLLDMQDGTPVVGMADTVTLLYVGMEAARRDQRGGGRGYTMNDAWAILEALGYLVVLPVVLEAFAAALSYTPEDGQGNPPA